MKRGRSKEKKTYEKPAYQAEEILEKMSLVCPTGAPACKLAKEGCPAGTNKS